MSGVVLLSGGLDSTVAFYMAVEKGRCRIALTFNYGQLSWEKEMITSRELCEKFGVEHRIIELPFLREISRRSGLLSGNLPESDAFSKKTAMSVWIPNRNALFANIGASFCEALNYRWVIAGFNAEEGRTFPDNSEAFVREMNRLWRVSTIRKPELWAPLVKMKKEEILREAIKRDVDIFSIWACYRAGEKHCGKCESCRRLKRAMARNGCLKRYEGMFKE